ncbi:TetR/AcrR family transcriptional regulator [Microbacterium sp. ACRRU]|jgi:AcrR family transcriptional regulator|uniref:TetR/AcrR family transcriptional regulator n=1 Tax=Microbacterium sp. ACRRU TaxID=2918204 RepID=UPI001EF48456|nr:TetR/AcrR family transcriptional regulator [Microbacterium sp. ACRRU]MCG7417475.1 TetR/AcrR family transcriptional regulator [Microbacterium sp. ACRRU]
MSMTARRRDAVENRAGIVDAATAVIGHDPRASIADIAARAGLSRRALYGHFDDRDAILREVIATGAARFNVIADTIDDPDSRVALARLASELWREAAHVQAAAALALDDTHLPQTSAALAPLRRRIDAIVRRGQEAGELRTDLPAPTLSRLLEETGRMVVARVDAESASARGIAVTAVLGIAGLSWTEARELLTQHPDLEAE